MQVIKKCQICNLKIAKFNCKLCGRQICEDDYDKDIGLCIICKQGKVIKK